MAAPSVIQLGHITVDIMNRVPLDVEIAPWERIDSKARGEAIASTIRTFIMIGSLVRWKQPHNLDFDLADLTGYREGMHTSVFGFHRNMGQVWLCPSPWLTAVRWLVNQRVPFAPYQFQRCTAPARN